MDQICEICGNELSTAASSCPYCGSRVEQSSHKKPFSHRVVNLEEGRPLLEIALNRMQNVIADSAKSHTVLTLIHGYGSSGRGGVIRCECRKMLDFMAVKGEIKGYVIGEDFTRRHPVAKEWLRRYPKLAENSYLGKGNRGITIVFL